MKKIACLVLACLIFLPRPAAAYWEWSRETGRWTHSRFSARETAEEQFRWAEEGAARGEYRDAVRRLRQLIRSFPRSPLVPAARFRIGEIYEETGDMRRAVQAYQELVERNPGSGEVLPAIERMFAISREMMARRGRFSLREDPGRQVLLLVEKAPYAPESEKMLYELGLYYADRGRHAQAAEIFERLMRTYPVGGHAADARFQLAAASYNLFRRQESNRSALLEAYHHVSAYLAAYPDGARHEDARELYRTVRERLAVMTLETARFYERTGRDGAAEIYYRQVIADFPETGAAAEARKNLP